MGMEDYDDDDLNSSDEGGDLRAELESAVEEHGGVIDDNEAYALEQESSEEQTDTETDRETPVRERDANGRFAKKAEEATVPDGADSPADPVADTDTQGQSPVADDIARAPQSLSPAAREQWANVPEAVQRDILRREHETMQAMEASASGRRTEQAVGAIQEKYQSSLQSAGVDIMTAADALFGTDQLLRSGSPQAKAIKLVEIAENYGVDINLVDQVLTGRIASGQINQNSPVVGGQPQQQQFQDPRFDQFLQSIQGEVEQRKQTQAQAAAQDVGSFLQQAEFGMDVREDMADIMEMAGKRGLRMTLDEAYDRACSLNPEISGILAQRNAAERGSNVHRSRNAASSVRSSPTAPPGASQADSNTLRGAIEAAINDQN